MKNREVNTQDGVRCAICGDFVANGGNNPAPITTFSESCCYRCNEELVIPTRIANRSRVDSLLAVNYRLLCQLALEIVETDNERLMLVCSPFDSAYSLTVSLSKYGEVRIMVNQTVGNSSFNIMNADISVNNDSATATVECLAVNRNCELMRGCDIPNLYCRSAGGFHLSEKDIQANAYIFEWLRRYCNKRRNNQSQFELIDFSKPYGIPDIV